MSLSTADLQLIEQRVQNEGPNLLVTYLLWFFLGVFSGHRFYMGRPGSAVLQILSYFILVGALWWLIDAALIPGMCTQKRAELRDRLIAQASAAKPAAPTATIAPNSPARSGVDTDRLQKLWELKQAGAISEQEFEAQKAKLLPS